LKVLLLLHDLLKLFLAVLKTPADIAAQKPGAPRTRKRRGAENENVSL
jgi:hypothetical protein